jgi:signal transduction histidine kinase
MITSRPCRTTPWSSYSGVYSDATGQGYQPQQVLESISTRTARPIVGLSPSYIDQLRPPQLGAMGLPAALRSRGARIQERSGVRVDVIERGWPKSLSSDIEIVLYRVVQEALQNVIKHSAASSVRIVLAVADGIAEATVLDDGKGMDGPHIDAGEKLGLIGMRERLALVQGTLKVQGGPESGTWLAARVPLPPTADDRG